MVGSCLRRRAVNCWPQKEKRPRREPWAFLIFFNSVPLVGGTSSRELIWKKERTECLASLKSYLRNRLQLAGGEWSMATAATYSHASNSVITLHACTA